MNEQEQATTPGMELEILPPEPAPPGPKLRHALTLANLWYIWIGLKNSAPRSVLLYQHVARRFCKFFNPHNYNGYRIYSLNPEGMVSWMQHLQKFKAFRKKKPLSANRINKINTIVKAFLRWMYKMRYINEDLASCIPHLFEPGRKDPAIITEEEYERIKEYCAGHVLWQTQLWLCILGYRTGMSLIDCCHLRWSDVHLDDNGPSYIDIRRIKIQRFGEKATCQIPIVPFSDIHLWLLNLRKRPARCSPARRRWAGRPNSGHFKPRENMIPRNRSWKSDDYVHQDAARLYHATHRYLRQDFIRIFTKAGVDPKKTFKCFRNSLCSNLVNSGVQIALVCKITGHNSVTTLLRYLKPDRRALQDGLAKAQQYSAIKADVENVSSGMQPVEKALI